MFVIKFKEEDFFSKILILELILLSGSLFQVVLFMPLWLLTFLTVIVSLLRVRYFNVKRLRYWLLSFGLFVCFLFSNFLLTISDEFNDYIILILQVLISSLVLLNFRERQVDIKLYLYKVTYFLSVLSLIGCLLSFLNIGWEWMFFSLFSVKTIFYVFYYWFYETIGPFVFYRNQGVFWEPGILMIYANILLFFSLFIYKNKRTMYVAILTILTTLSTSGILIMGIQFLYWVFSRKKVGVLYKLLILVLSVMFFLLATFSLLEKKKISEEQTAYSSYALRVYDLYIGYQIIKAHPLLGIGVNNKSYLAERDKNLSVEMEGIYHLIEDRGSANSFIIIFSCFGLFIGGSIVYFYYNQSIVDKYKKLFFLILMLGLTNEPLFFTPFFLLVLLTGIDNTFKKLNFK